ncbi:hypothetical protein FOZ61_006148 [Perkinsus olseni]|uniref:Uncharacterized protein n=1 Tax=Perkinsus olseni TaxID=32597 RepID=A0A7J6LEG2_PEROL|nr:hypothetical protein FOZ61_006148 [Perkinsus olseni]
MEERIRFLESEKAELKQGGKQLRFHGWSPFCHWIGASSRVGFCPQCSHRNLPAEAGESRGEDRIPAEELATSGTRITPWPVRDACSATELRLADREAQARVYVWDWPESSHGLSPRHIGKSELGRLVTELNVGKGLAQFSIFYRRLPSGAVNARFIVKYWGSRRWVKMSQTLRTVYGIHASTLQGSRGSLNYDSLFNDCLLGDPEPLLSPNHPPVPLPDYIPTISRMTGILQPSS